MWLNGLELRQKIVDLFSEARTTNEGVPTRKNYVVRPSAIGDNAGSAVAVRKRLGK